MRIRERLLLYEGDVAMGVAIRIRDNEDAQPAIELDIPEWKKLPGGRVHLAAVYVFEVAGKELQATVYREKA